MIFFFTMSIKFKIEAYSYRFKYISCLTGQLVHNCAATAPATSAATNCFDKISEIETPFGKRILIKKRKIIE